MNDLLDLDKCAVCGIKLNEDMLEIGNNDVVMQNPALKPMFNALQKGEPLPAAAKSPAKQTKKAAQSSPIVQQKKDDSAGWQQKYRDPKIS